MVLHEHTIEEMVAKYIPNNSTIALGTAAHSATFLKKIAFKIFEENYKIQVIPTSAKIAAIASSLGIQMASVNEAEIDVAIEFVTQADENFNFIKNETHSLVRDKIVAQTAGELIAIIEKENFVKKLSGKLCFEITTFGWKKTMAQLDLYGKAKLRENNSNPIKTESGNYLVDVEIDEIHSIEELETRTKNIPGVIETSLFLGYADRIIMHNGDITVKSRIRKNE